MLPEDDSPAGPRHPVYPGRITVPLRLTREEHEALVREAARQETTPEVLAVHIVRDGLGLNW